MLSQQPGDRIVPQSAGNIDRTHASNVDRCRIGSSFEKVRHAIEIASEACDMQRSRAVEVSLVYKVEPSRGESGQHCKQATRAPHREEVVRVEVVEDQQQELVREQQDVGTLACTDLALDDSTVIDRRSRHGCFSVVIELDQVLEVVLRRLLRLILLVQRVIKLVTGDQVAIAVVRARRVLEPVVLILVLMNPCSRMIPCTGCRCGSGSHVARRLVVDLIGSSARRGSRAR